ncbi:MAG: tetratricopeptide repeat protein [Deltaproteobacteria bacterium]|nr:tetratricopeptide repeat protein [Deltaproteobacteria bacterium]
MADHPDSTKLRRLHDAVEVAGGSAVDADALVASAAEALRTKAYENAAAILDTALTLEPEHAEAWALRGATFEQLGQPDEAIRAYETALSIDDRDPISALALAALYVRASSVERAKALLSWLILEEDVPADLRQRAGVLLESLASRTRA